MKIALAQINTTVGDIRGNLEKIRGFYGRARDSGADLVMFPELSVPGYPPRDLLEQRDFVRSNLGAVRELARGAGDAGLIVGYVEPHTGRTGKSLYNAAALLHKGRVAERRFKTLLPEYDVFDESRYFEPAAGNAPLTFRGVRIGLTICEDAWGGAELSRRVRYGVDPVKAQVKAGARVLLNIAASPFERGKGALRRKLLRGHATRGKRPMLYCALVGGNDELIFDGGSMAVDAKGKTLLRGKSFQEDMILVDPDASARDASWEDPEDAEELHSALVLGIRDYMGKCGFRDAVVGLSGGIDSAVVCALAADALGPEHVTGVSMPSMHSSEGSVTDAEALASNLGVRLYQIPITAVYDAMLGALDEAFRDTEPGAAEQNIQARIRGNLLMALSNKTGALLLSTGNKSELSVGYCTLYGDMSGGLAVIADVPKTTVYELARWMNRDEERIPEASITKPPSAELAPNQKDQDDLPAYETLDAVMTAYVEEGLDETAIVKRGQPLDVVRDILSRIDRNEYKRRQAPPALRVSPKAFGAGRRMPIARGSHRSY